MKNYNLPPSAKAIFDTFLLPAIWQAQSNLMYLASCCLNDGYKNAARYFFDKSLSAHDDFKSLVSYMASRGVEADVPKTVQPEVEFTDLKSAVLYRKDMETALAVLYDDKARQMFEIDLSAYSRLMDFLSGQVYSIKSAQEQWLVIEKAKDEADQTEFEQMLFGCKPEEPKMASS